VTHPTSKLKWISNSIPGKVQGVPIVTKVDPGLYVFFTHNERNATTGEVVGIFSMINGMNGDLMFSEIAGESKVDPEPEQLSLLSHLRLPYTALGVSYAPDFGRYNGGDDNIRDLFVWSTSDLEGRGENGYTRAFQLPQLFEPEFASDLFTYFLREVRWNAIAAPAVTEDGMSVVFGTRENVVQGWTGSEDFNGRASLELTLGPDPEDELRRKYQV
jgi:hypothetical protein